MADCRSVTGSGTEEGEEAGGENYICIKVMGLEDGLSSALELQPWSGPPLVPIPGHYLPFFSR